ncbi:phospho-2-dehydro-3-deoxyheptonate aldolase [Alkalispirochaeta sphaeroplastigenens]|uniref:Phospho-2-dehydro-3-deoxyheptonate aldolase n=1 Tax=Alkalispirochaeta sphaeroplastigenens TaxID=1187066 RepID=A0A2S4JRQ7_9SPIO|nr:3-deoxy-7-phosphoheptulonate synthase [Alkalispirochaeta sphaeroplastigenens]POR02217.1 phospho-2-dehydro-3-deoxyheptonate aldolase [Alkalispirochaeta sphaeroplastigenens]
MVVVLEKGVTPREKEAVRAFLTDRGFQVREVAGEEETILGAVGSGQVDHREVEMQPGVARVVPITKPYKLASREFKKADSVFSVGPVKIGGNRLVVIAGPCAVESREQILECADIVASSGGVMLRGGAFKPRTSPYSFQGLGEEGLRYLKEAGERYGMPVITEIVASHQVEVMRDYVDVFQIGARNMQNFELLKVLGAEGRPVMLKRGLSATIEEWLMAAEYLLAHGAEDIILCERGIRTFETYTRNSLDISSIPVVKKLSHLPVLVDPSHATGLRDQVIPVGLAGIAAGADGLIVEVHPDPPRAASDGPQTLYPEQFEKLLRDIEVLSPVVEREVARLPRKSVKPAAEQGTEPGRKTLDQGPRTVAFQGSKGAFSEAALLRYFGDAPQGVEPRSFPHFRDVFEAVLSGEVHFGIVPLENSLMGSIHQNYDLLLQYPDVTIVGETQIRIEHSLIGTPDASIETIKKVISQGPGIEQCRDFLDAHPHWTVTPFFDTAGSVAYLQECGDPSLAAIANARTADVYGMKVLRQGIESNPRNYTRFAILVREDQAEGVADANMATVVFSTPDKPGALYQCMKVLAERQLNLKKLESRPLLGQPWRYMFYADVELSGDQEQFDLAMKELDSETHDLRLLGTFREARGYARS